MDDEFMRKLITIRGIFRRPMIISSAYRSASHPIEIKKGHSNGAHAQGRAVDVVCYGQDAIDLVRIALQQGITGIGVSQAGERSKRFLHLDDLDSTHAPRPWIWSY